MAEAGLIVSGRAAAWSEDREAELFEPESFDRGIQKFMQNPVLAYMHAKAVAETVKGPSNYVQLGAVTSLERRPDGLWFEAFVPRVTSGGFLEDVYTKVKAGILKAVSVGGRFAKRIGRDGKARIYEVDLQEISLAPVGVNADALVYKVEPVDSAPLLTSCGENCVIDVGQAGKAAPGVVNLNTAIELEELAAGLRDISRALQARVTRERIAGVQGVRRDVARLRAMAGLDL